MLSHWQLETLPKWDWTGSAAVGDGTLGFSPGTPGRSGVSGAIAGSEHATWSRPCWVPRNAGSCILHASVVKGAYRSTVARDNQALWPSQPTMSLPNLVIPFAVHSWPPLPT